MKTLTNPFEIYTEKKLLITGVLLLIITALVSSYSNLLLFGSLKVINNYKQTWYEATANLGITLLTNTLLLFLFARLKNTKTRSIDVLNVVLIAHIVVYVILFVTALPFVRDAITAVELEVLDKGFQAPSISKLHMFILGAFGVITISLIIYFFYLLVVGMKIAMNSKSKIDAILIVGLVLVWNTILQLINPFI